MYSPLAGGVPPHRCSQAPHSTPTPRLGQARPWPHTPVLGKPSGLWPGCKQALFSGLISATYLQHFKHCSAAFQDSTFSWSPPGFAPRVSSFSFADLSLSPPLLTAGEAQEGGLDCVLLLSLRSWWTLAACHCLRSVRNLMTPSWPLLSISACWSTSHLCVGISKHC